MTADKREKGPKLSRPLAEFGELVPLRQLRERESGRTEKSEPRLEDGIHLGVGDRCGESRIGIAYGVVKGRDVRRKLDSERSCASAMRMFVGTAWDPTPEGSAEMTERLSAIRWNPGPRLWNTASQLWQHDG